MALIEFENQNGIAILTLNRPETLNALSPQAETFDAIEGLPQLV
jgi:enoyl-CoA hydratase/carnithine racemase